MSAKRVAYLVNQYPKVSHSFIRTEIQELERQGFDVLRLAVRGWDAELVDADDEVERTRTHYLLCAGAMPLLGAFLACLVSDLPATMRGLAAAIRMARGGDRPLPYHFIYLLEACRAIRLVRRFGASHIHAHFGSNSAEVAMLAGIVGGVSYSFTVHGPEEFDKPFELKLAEKIARAAFVVAITSFCRSQLYRFARLADWDKIAIVHCGLPEAFLHTPPVPIPNDHHLVCVGRLCEQKGQLLLVRAVAKLVARGVPVRLTLAGDGEMRGDIERAITDAGIGAHVRITGWVTGAEIRNLLSTAKAMVLPSFAEGLPVVIMEAMALGRPTITTFIAGIPELVRDGRDGWLVIAGDEDALVDAMASALGADFAVLEEMGQSARARVAERHCAATEVAKLAALFERASGH